MQTISKFRINGIKIHDFFHFLSKIILNFNQFLTLLLLSNQCGSNFNIKQITNLDQVLKVSNDSSIQLKQSTKIDKKKKLVKQK